MSPKDATTTAVELLQKRLDEISPQLDALSAEADTLRSGIAALTGVSKTTRRSSRGKGPSGPSVADQVLPMVTENPSITVADLAEKLGVEKTYLYNVTSRLRKAGKLDRKDDRWVVPA